MAYICGCLMANFQFKNWKDLTSLIKKEDIYDNEEHEFGIETKPHCTIVFGFDKKITINDIKPFLTIPLDKIKVEADAISLFENDEFDVVKISCKSDALKTLNSSIMKEFDIHSDYPDYEPHITIAYTKPGMGKKYVKKFRSKLNFTPKYFTYSSPDKQTIKFKL